MPAILLLSLLTFLFSVSSQFAEAQPPAKLPTIGYLGSSITAGSANLEAFRQGLRELGYIEGQNIAIEYRATEGKPELIPALAAELVRLKVDVILVAGGTQSVLPAKRATNSIPIVFTSVGDPVASGIVASVARPGGNITGLTSASPELSGKRLELLKEAIPRLSHVAVLWNPNGPGNVRNFKETEVAAQGLTLQLQSLEVRKADDFAVVFDAVTKGRPGALVTMSNTLIGRNQKRVVDFAIKSRLPAMFPGNDWVDDGGLMSYGPDFDDNYRRAATYVDKILKSAKPADLPVQQPTKFELVINLKTAKQIGLTIPPNVLARADRVIK